MKCFCCDNGIKLPVIKSYDTFTDRYYCTPCQDEINELYLSLIPEEEFLDAAIDSQAQNIDTPFKMC